MILKESNVGRGVKGKSCARRACSPQGASAVAVESKKEPDSLAGIPDLIEHAARLRPFVDVPVCLPEIHASSYALYEILLFSCLAQHREVLFIEACDDVLQSIDGIVANALLERLFCKTGFWRE